MENIEQTNKRADSKNITVGNREFRLNKFDAFTGTYMLFKVVGIIAPMFESIDIKGIKGIVETSKENNDDVDMKDIVKVFKELSKLPKKDFDYIQKECLKVVEEVYPDNPGHTSKVVNNLGNFEILDPNTPLILNLTIQSLIFNVSGFFGENLSALNLEGLTTSLQNLLT